MSPDGVRSAELGTWFGTWTSRDRNVDSRVILALGAFGDTVRDTPWLLARQALEPPEPPARSVSGREESELRLHKVKHVRSLAREHLGAVRHGKHRRLSKPESERSRP